MTSLILAGLSMAGVAVVGRVALRTYKNVNWTQVAKAVPNLPEFNLNAYYKGGFEAKMSKREAALVLGVGQGSNIQKIRDAHRRIMIANHPDKGGSPYLASKINEAKDIMEGKTKGS